MDEDEESENDREKREEDEEDEDDNESQAKVDRRVSEMLKEQHHHLQMCSTSAQILQMLSQLVPGVPENAHVVELESVSDDSDDSTSTPRSRALTGSPGSGENSECVIWAEPLMSCQIVPVWKQNYDDVRRLPPGVRPDNLKKEAPGQSQGGVSSTGSGNRLPPTGGPGPQRPLYKPGNWSGCLPPRGMANGLLGERNLAAGNSTKKPTEDEAKTSPATKSSSNQTSSRINAHTSTALSRKNCSPVQKSSLSVQTTDPTVPVNISTQTTPNRPGYGLHNLGVSQFGHTHNEFNDAMLKISSAANTIRQARLLLSSMDPNCQINNNYNPDTLRDEKEGENRQSGDGTYNSSSAKRAMAAADCSANSNGTRPAENSEGATESSSAKTASPENFRAPILVKSAEVLEAQPKQVQNDPNEDKSNTTAEPSFSSTAREQTSLPLDSRGGGQSTVESQMSHETVSRSTGPSVQPPARLSSNLPRRNANLNRTPWSLRMTSSEYQAARIARCPRIYGPLTRPAGSNASTGVTNRNQQSTLLGNSSDLNRTVSSPGEDRALAPIAEVRSARQDELTVGDDARRDTGSSTAPAPKQGQRVRHTITLEDFRNALAWAIRKLQKTDGWISNENNLYTDTNLVAKNCTNAFMLTDVDTVKIPLEQSNKNEDTAANTLTQLRTVGDAGAGDGADSIKTRTEVVNISINRKGVADSQAVEAVSKKRLFGEVPTKGKVVTANVSNHGTENRGATTSSVCVVREIRSHSSLSSSKTASRVSLVEKHPAFSASPVFVQTMKDIQQARLLKGDGSDVQGSGEFLKGNVNDHFKDDGVQSHSMAPSVTRSDSSYKDTTMSLESYHEEIPLTQSEFAFYKRNWEGPVDEFWDAVGPVNRGMHTTHSNLANPSNYNNAQTPVTLKQRSQSVQVKPYSVDFWYQDATTNTDISVTGFVLSGTNRDKPVLVKPSKTCFTPNLLSCAHVEDGKRIVKERPPVVVKGEGAGDSAPLTKTEGKPQQGDAAEALDEDTVTMKSVSVGSAPISSVRQKFTFIRRRPPRPVSYQDACRSLEDVEGPSALQPDSISDELQYSDSSREDKPEAKILQPDCVNDNNAGKSNGESPPDTKDNLSSLDTRPKFYVTESGNILKPILVDNSQCRTPFPSINTNVSTSLVEGKVETGKEQSCPSELWGAAKEVLAVHTPPKVDLEESLPRKVTITSGQELADPAAMSEESSSVAELGVTREGNTLPTPPSSPALIAPTNPMRERRSRTRRPSQNSSFRERVRGCFRRCFHPLS